MEKQLLPPVMYRPRQMKRRRWWVFVFQLALLLVAVCRLTTFNFFPPLMQWFSSGTTFSEFGGPGRGHYKMSKSDKRENTIMVSNSHRF